VRSDQTRAVRRGAARRESGKGEPEQRRASPLASPTRRRQPMFGKLGRAIPRAAGTRFSWRALISSISKINISIIIANITKWYGTFISISILSTFLWAVGKSGAEHPVYINALRIERRNRYCALIIKVIVMLCDYLIREIDATKLIDTLRYSSCDRHASKSINHFGHAGAYLSFPVVSFLINQVIDTYESIQVFFHLS